MSEHVPAPNQIRVTFIFSGAALSYTMDESEADKLVAAWQQGDKGRYTYAVYDRHPNDAYALSIDLSHVSAVITKEVKPKRKAFAQ